MTSVIVPSNCYTHIIPQIKDFNTCWFNAIIMTILYSQHSRNLLLSNHDILKKYAETDKISAFLLYILNNNFMKKLKGILKFESESEKEKQKEYSNLLSEMSKD